MSRCGRTWRSDRPSERRVAEVKEPLAPFLSLLKGPPLKDIQQESHCLVARFAGLAWQGLCCQVVLTAVEQDGNAFQFAALQLRGDRDFVLPLA